LEERANICLFDAPGIVLGCDMVDKMLNGVREDYTPEDWSKNLLEKANDVDTIDYVIVVLSALDLEGNSGWIFRSVQWQMIFLPDDVNKLIRVKTDYS